MSVSSFFNHYSLEFGIRQGWDFEEDYSTFVERNKEIYASNEAMKIKEQSFSELDIFNASRDIKGLVPALYSVLSKIAEEHKDTPDACILQSMHSGSSDYLFVKDLL